MQRLEARVAHSGQLLAALSYRGVLARGFALVRDEQGHAVHAAAGDRTGRAAQIWNLPTDASRATADADRPAATPAAGASRLRERAEEPPAPKRVVKAGRSGKFVLETYAPVSPWR